MGHYNNGHHTHSQGGDHFSFGRKLLRALLSIFTSVGFGAFWYALITETDEALIWIAGISLMAIGVIHIFVGIKKDSEHRSKQF